MQAELNSLLSLMQPKERDKVEKETARTLLDMLIAQGLYTADDVRHFVKALIGFDLPEKSVCPGHSSPMKFVIDDVIGEGGVDIVEANRDGYKTFALAAANLCHVLGKNASVLHLGAVEKQAKNGAKYVAKMLEKTGLKDYVLKTTKEEFVFKNDATMQIAACTINQTNSPRAPVVRVDEGDLAEPQSLAESKGVCSTDLHGNSIRWTMVSSRKFADGNMHLELEKALANGDSHRVWCYKEVTERCPDKKSGTEPVTLWIDPTNLSWMTEEQYDQSRLSRVKLPTDVEDKSDSFQQYSMFKGCLKCKLVATCRGDLKHSEGNRPIKDLEMMFASWDVEDWISQKECRGVPSSGRMYRHFSVDRNVPEDDFPVFLDWKTKKPLGRMFWGKDWGYEHPDVTVVIQETLGRCGHKHYWIHDENYINHKSDEEIIKQLIYKGWCKLDKEGRISEEFGESDCKYGKPIALCADPSDRKAAKIYRQMGFRVRRKPSLVEDGVKEIRRLIFPSTCKETHLHIHKRCKRLISDFERYSKKRDKSGEPTEAPAKGGENAPDHGPDAVRMVISMVVGKREWMMQGGEE